MLEKSLLEPAKRWFLLFVTLMVTACQPQQATLTVAASPWLGFEPFHLAKQLKIPASNAYRMHELTTPSHVMHALRSNQVDAALLSLSEAITLLSEGVELSVIGVIDKSHGGDALVAQQEIESISELKGRKIGYESLTVASLLMDDWLKDSQLAAEDFMLVEAKLDEQLDLFRRGEIDAVMTAGPLQRRLVENLSANVIYDSAVDNKTYYRVLVVRNAIMKTQRNNLSHLLKSFYQAQQWLREHPREGYKLIAKRTQLYSKEVKEAFARVVLLDEQEAKLLLESELVDHAKQRAQRMNQLNMISSKPAMERVFLASWLQEQPGV